MLAVLGIPAIDRCNGDGRGLVECLRGQVDDKFDLGLDPPPATAPQTVAASEPVVTEVPVVAVVETLPVKPPVEATRSLVPQLKTAPPGLAQSQVVAAPRVTPVPDLPAATPEPPPVADLPAPKERDAEPVETIALAAPAEPTAPSFVPPLPLVAVDGVPPDLTIAAEPVAAAPDFALPATPALPTSPPPDLTAAAVEPEVEAPSFVPPASPLAIEGVPPDLQVAVAEPEPAIVAEPAPALALPTIPAQPDLPQPALAVAAVDPVIPVEALPPAVPVLAPSIDAVEIDGDGNFIAGNGPAGATMRLYVDGIPIGVSLVEGGRWLVEGSNLLTEEQQTLKVEAIDPLTGKVLGDATIVFEGPMTPDQPPPAAEPAEVPPEVEPATNPVAEPAQPEAVAEPPLVPPLDPVAPMGETASVTILKPSGSSAITTLATGNLSAGAVVTLGTKPKSPAVIAQFNLPISETAPDVTVLRAIPIGDPGAGRFVSGKAIIRRGDTLWDIAHRYYGSGIRYGTILRANRDLIARPGRIYPGQVLKLPLVYDD